MLSISNINQKGIFTRVVTDNNGSLVRVRFEVYEIDGVLKGHILSIEPVISLKADPCSTAQNKANRFSLPCPTCNSNTTDISWFDTSDIVSPYSSLYLLTNIKIRAPAF
jgi:Zn finger protein HypA/HybF involved in hydrogenase expression